MKTLFLLLGIGVIQYTSLLQASELNNCYIPTSLDQKTITVSGYHYTSTQERIKMEITLPEINIIDCVNQVPSQDSIYLQLEGTGSLVNKKITVAFYRGRSNDLISKQTLDELSIIHTKHDCGVQTPTGSQLTTCKGFAIDLKLGSESYLAKNWKHPFGNLEDETMRQTTDTLTIYYYKVIDGANGYSLFWGNNQFPWQTDIKVQ